MFKTNQTTKVATLVLIGAFIVLCGVFLCNPAKGQASPSGFNGKVVTPKRYVFVLDSVSYVTVDSILRLSLQVTGYELKASQADGLRQGLSMVITYFQREKMLQDTITTKSKK